MSVKKKIKDYESIRRSSKHNPLILKNDSTETEFVSYLILKFASVTSLL